MSSRVLTGAIVMLARATIQALVWKTNPGGDVRGQPRTWPPSIPASGPSMPSRPWMQAGPSPA
jgi:hypothetical protein